MNSNTPAKMVEALLFALGRPLKRAELAERLHISLEMIDASIKEIQARDGGITLVDDGSSVELRTSAAVSDIIEGIRKEEYTREIGRAGLETLAAILYRGPISRSEIDFIRGVNSSQILRTLTMKGLVRKVIHPDRARAYRYEATTELLSTLSIRQLSELPEYRSIQEKLLTLETAYKMKISAEPEV